MVLLDIVTGDVLNTYLALFKGHTEIYQHVRVVFTGKEGAGKTTVCCRLQNKYVNLKLRRPTVGANLYPDLFSIDRHSNNWMRNADNSTRKVIEARIGAVMTRVTRTGEDGLRTGGPQGRLEQNEKYSSKDPVPLTTERLSECDAVREASRHASSDATFLSLWDMGGHSSFQTSHNVFISSHGVYLLVFRLTDFLKDRLETYRLKKWIRMIGTFSSKALNVSKLKTHHPPLIFIGTFLDELKRKNKDYDRQVQAIQSSITSFPELSSHKYVRFCTVDNSKGTKPILLRLRHFFRKRFQHPSPPFPPCTDDDKLTHLRKCVLEFAEHQDQWGRQLPTRWLKLEMDLMKLREEGTRILKLEEVIEMNRESMAPLDDVKEIKLALQYLHCTRSVIYFPEFDYVINDPQWLADCFGLLITDDQFLPKDDLVLAQDLEKYKTKGELTQKLVDRLLSLEQNKAFLPHKSILLALMEKFGLIVRLLISESKTANERFSEKYTIPSKLMELETITDITDDVNNLKQNNLDVSQTLCFIFHDVFVPEELFHRVFATIMKTFISVSLSARLREDELKRNPPTTNDTTCLYRGFGCFEVNELCRMILSMHWERSTIAVTLFSPSESKLPPHSGTLVRNSLERILRETLQMSNQQHFQYTYKLHCNFHLSPYDTPVEIYSVIHAEAGMSCKGDECRGKHRLTQSDLLFWDIPKNATQVHGLGSNHEEICLDRRPTSQELGRLSYMVEASKCQRLFIELGLSLPEISNIEHETRRLAVVTQITKMFLKWTYTYPNGTFRQIKTAMSKVGMATDTLGEAVGWESVILDDMEFNRGLHRRLVVSDIGLLVDKIGKDFFNLCLELGLSVSNIDMCEMDHLKAKHVIEALIKLWIETFQEQATVSRILKAMKLCNMNWYSTARRFI
ncbi:uncharacterized protein LOC110462276 [Mizuhopecten yessoensis]|uniref:uncharacterized protein LOC110462276 n=1 Tax=Mizuhopecten yessoensis TaxID=6573 RepID=UPI000B4594F2|nr:uncharacterized protein LOC110462276 [Mizuhopecten yessoensis]